MRNVFPNIPRRTDFETEDLPGIDNDIPDIVGIECLDTTKIDGIKELGKQVTLGALIWGFIPG